MQLLLLLLLLLTSLLPTSAGASDSLCRFEGSGLVALGTDEATFLDPSALLLLPPADDAAFPLALLLL
jgi:hypothetical protein